jgi:hypothetical protein
MNIEEKKLLLLVALSKAKKVTNSISKTENQILYKQCTQVLRSCQYKVVGAVFGGSPTLSG